MAEIVKLDSSDYRIIYADQIPLLDASQYLNDCIEIWHEVNELKPDHKYGSSANHMDSFEREWLQRIYSDIDEDERKLISFEEFERLFSEEVNKPIPNNFSINEMNNF